MARPQAREWSATADPPAAHERLGIYDEFSMLFPLRHLGAMPVPSVMEQVMIAAGSAAGEEAESHGERGMAFMLALFLGAVQVGWLGLLLWVTYQIIGAI